MIKIIEKLKQALNFEKLKNYFKENQSSVENLNTFMKKKQNLWGCIVILSLLLITFVLHELAKSKEHHATKSIAVSAAQSVKVPDGILSNDFTQKNTQSALEAQQQQIDQLNKFFKKINDASKKNDSKNDSSSAMADNNIARPVPASGTIGAASNLSLSKIALSPTVTANGGISVLPVAPVVHHSLTTQTFHYNHYQNTVFHRETHAQENNDDNNSDIRTPKTWVPAGTFARVVLLVGADANASVNGQSDTVPILMRFLDQGTLPNGFHSHLKGCFALASIYGDISSERGEARLNKLSCTKKDGSILEIPVQGFIAFAGKEGIRGIPVMRNGKILTMAGISGALSGVGSALAQGAQTQSISPLGTTTTVTGSQVWRSGAYTGASTAMGELANYYIKRANQYHPIISIGSGTVSTVVFQTGFSLVTKTDSNSSNNSNELNNSNNNDNASSANNAQSDFVSPSTNNNNASEIKSLITQAQISAQEKQDTKGMQLTDGTSSEGLPSNAAQIQMGQSISNNQSGVTNND